MIKINLKEIESIVKRFRDSDKTDKKMLCEKNVYQNGQVLEIFRLENEI